MWNCLPLLSPPASAACSRPCGFRRLEISPGTDFNHRPTASSPASAEHVSKMPEACAVFELGTVTQIRSLPHPLQAEVQPPGAQLSSRDWGYCAYPAVCPHRLPTPGRGWVVFSSLNSSFFTIVLMPTGGQQTHGAGALSSDEGKLDSEAEGTSLVPGASPQRVPTVVGLSAPSAGGSCLHRLMWSVNK